MSRNGVTFVNIASMNQQFQMYPESRLQPVCYRVLKRPITG